MHDAAEHITELELEQGLTEVLASPDNTGRLAKRSLFALRRTSGTRSIQLASHAKAESTAIAGRTTVTIAPTMVRLTRGARYR